MRRYLCSERLIVRFASLFAVSLVLFLIAWSISYHYLPEGVLRGGGAAARPAQVDDKLTLMPQFARLFAWNILAMGIIAMFSRLFRINGYPLGYLVPVFWMTLYGLMLGSNSLGVALPERMAPSLAILGRSGLYEFIAHHLLAVATYSISLFQVKKLFITIPERVAESQRPWLTRGQTLAALLSILILAGSNLWEASMIIGRM